MGLGHLLFEQVGFVCVLFFAFGWGLPSGALGRMGSQNNCFLFRGVGPNGCQKLCHM